MSTSSSEQLDSLVDGHGVDPDHPPGPAHERLADALRRVVHQLVITDASPEQLNAAAAQVEAVADSLAPVTPPWTVSAPPVPNRREPHVALPYSPQIGLANPLAPPVRVWVDDDAVVHGTARLDNAYEGPPGWVHGGVIASIFDELLGIANMAAGSGALTGGLTITYRSPTPLHRDLTFTARRSEIDGRKIRAVGTIHVGDRLCAEAEGVFIAVDPSRFRPGAKQSS